MPPKDTVASLSVKLETALAKIEAFVNLAEKLEAVIKKIEVLVPFVAKLEAALSTIEEQAVEIAVLKTKLAAYDDRISANTITADTAQRLSNSNAQYARRETIELYDFPDTVADEDVEMVAVKIISASGVKVSPSDFQAVHRKKNRKVVIAKLKCRKKAGRLSRNEET